MGKGKQIVRFRIFYYCKYGGVLILTSVYWLKDKNIKHNHNYNYLLVDTQYKKL